MRLPFFLPLPSRCDPWEVGCAGRVGLVSPLLQLGQRSGDANRGGKPTTSDTPLPHDVRHASTQGTQGGRGWVEVMCALSRLVLRSSPDRRFLPWCCSPLQSTSASRFLLLPAHLSALHAPNTPPHTHTTQTSHSHVVPLQLDVQCAEVSRERVHDDMQQPICPRGGLATADRPATSLSSDASRRMQLVGLRRPNSRSLHVAGDCAFVQLPRPVQQEGQHPVPGTG